MVLGALEAGGIVGEGFQFLAGNDEVLRDGPIRHHVTEGTLRGCVPFFHFGRGFAQVLCNRVRLACGRMLRALIVPTSGRLSAGMLVYHNVLIFVVGIAVGPRDGRRGGGR